MKAVLLSAFGPADNLYIGDWPTPEPKAGELLVKIAATALNRADILQRQGHYPPPPGESSILGLEMAGTVVATGPAVTSHQTGDRVCGLLAGGGYAEYALIAAEMALPVPERLSLEEAAAIPEVFLTAFQALQWIGNLQAGEKILIHAGASGVGTAAIQLAGMIGAETLVTASASKHNLCLDLGAALAIDYHSEDFVEKVKAYTGGEGVDLVLDFIAAPYFQQNIEVLKLDGRLVMLALLGGAQAEQVNLAKVLRKRLSIFGSTLRSRSLTYKIALTHALQAFAWEAFRTGKLKPVVDRIFSWKEVAAAHRYMETNSNKGKIVLKID